MHRLLALMLSNQDSPAKCLRHMRYRTDAHAGPLHTQAKGGSFVGDNKDFFRFRLGERAVIPAFEEAVETMRVRARRAYV